MTSDEKFIVIGAGMAGLLAAAMLRDNCEKILERQKSLPNNHSALLRFRSSVVGDTLGIQFRPVNVIKEVKPYAPTDIGDAIAYSRKCTGFGTLRSILSASDNSPQKRWIAPPDLISKMASKITAPVIFGKDAEFTIKGLVVTPKISTMPMPALMKILGYHADVKFKYVNGWNLSAQIPDCDIHATIYYPSTNLDYNRASITGDLLTIEYSMPGIDDVAFTNKFTTFNVDKQTQSDHIIQVLQDFGLPSVIVSGSKVAKQQRYSKILPIDDRERKKFMMWATDKYNVYSLGRFATWRPGLLLDDVVNDVRVIQSLAHGHSTVYDHIKTEKEHA